MKQKNILLPAKRRTGAWLLALAALLASCSGGNKTADYPLVEATNTQTIDIARVELTDTATIIRTDAYYQPNYWICISSESYLRAEGKRYRLTGAEGITPDSLFWMPDSGKAHFTLRFEPLPAGTRSFDFIESDCDDCFKLYGIDLTGKQAFDTPDEVPAELQQIDLQAAVPDPILKTGTTTVRIHLLHYRPELGREVNMYVNTLLGRQQPYENIPVDTATATATLSFLQCGTAQAALVSAWGSLMAEAYLAPGDTTDVYVDMRYSGYQILQNRHENGVAGAPAPFRRAYVSGTYANLSNAENLLEDGTPYYGMDLFTGKFADYRMTSAEYAAHVAERYKALADSIGQSALPPLEKELSLLTLQEEAFYAMAEGDYLRDHNYRHEHNAWDFRQDVMKGIELQKPEDAKAVCALFDINNPKLLMGRAMSDYVRAACSAGFDWPRLAGTERGLVADLRQVEDYYDKAENIALTDEDFARLKAMDTPFFLDAFTQIQKENQAKLAAAELKAQVMDTPDVPKEKLFEALIAPHKGKVVLVDFWNTWCGPCRAAIKTNEPLKSGELKSDGLVWLYIANETSPLVTYKTMIPDIRGLHYRLNEEQWDYLCNKFQIDGIPSYVLVDKAGKYALRNDFRDHELMKRTLKEELKK